jgi:hypothetical protein
MFIVELDASLVEFSLIGSTLLSASVSVFNTLFSAEQSNIKFYILG